MNLLNFTIIIFLGLLVYTVLSFKEKYYLASSFKVFILSILFLAEFFNVLNLNNSNEQVAILSVMISAFFLLEIVDVIVDMRKNGV